MTEQFLIAHKVRGQPAFDIAERSRCPECAGELERIKCDECDDTGYWWICSTSGHRAYPIMNWPITDLHLVPLPNTDWWPRVLDITGPLEASPDFGAAPDHYPANPSPTFSLLARLGLTKREPKVTRR